MTAANGFARCARAPLALAFTALAAAAFAAEAPRRLDAFVPPAGVALTGLDRAATVESSALFSFDAPPAVAVTGSGLRAQAPAPDPLDLAWSLLDPARRSLVAALDDWANAPEARGSAERRRVRSALADAYRARDYAPFWMEAGGLNAAGVAALTRLNAAGEDGLDLRAYPIPAADGVAPMAVAELAVTEAVAAYALQARGARVDPERISRLIGAQTTLPEPGRAVAEVSAAGGRAGEVLQAFNPPHYGYQQLRDKLAELRAQRTAAPAADERFAEAVEGAPQSDAEPSGKSRRRRAAAVVRDPAARAEAEILANMERWRWLPRDLGAERVEVNIPDFELAVVRHGEVAHRTRVIVGKEETPTPIFSNALQFIIVNPYWNVPQSIIQKEMLPKGGVETLEGRGFKVSYRRGQLVVRQPPGERNALGRIKFMFPNDFAVYMHDTPSRGLFSAAHRAFSHGCMRVQEPFALAEAVLGPGSGWSEARVRKLIGGSERYINLDKPLPIHIEYFTAYVDEGGRLVLRPDLYGYSARVRRALGLAG